MSRKRARYAFDVDTLISAVQKFPVLWDRSAPESCEEWDDVAQECNASKSAAIKEWRKLLIEHDVIKNKTKKATTSGAGTSREQTTPELFEKLSFLREGVPRRGTVTNLSTENPFKPPVMPRPGPRRQRSASENVNEKLSACCDLLMKRMDKPAHSPSVEEALALEIGEKLMAQTPQIRAEFRKQLIDMSANLDKIKIADASKPCGSAKEDM